MYRFFDSYYYKDTLIRFESMTFEIVIAKYPVVLKIYQEIGPELDKLNQLRKEFMDKYEYVISFHPFYTIYNNIKRPGVSLHRKKEKFLDSRFTFSIASKSRATLISFNNSEQIYIPEILSKKKIKIEKLVDFKSSKEKIFNKNRPKKEELDLIIETLIILNSKMETFFKSKIPFTLLANEDSWDRVFFKI